MLTLGVVDTKGPQRSQNHIIELSDGEAARFFVVSNAPKRSSLN